MSATFLESTSPAASSPAERSAVARWAGRIATVIVVLFMLVDIGIKLVSAKVAVDSTVQLGYQPHHVPLIGALGLACLIIYLIPRTAPIGAVLWTGYLGGAVASNLRLDNPLFSHTLFPVYVAILLWAGLYARDQRVGAFIGPRPRR